MAITVKALDVVKKCLIHCAFTKIIIYSIYSALTTKNTHPNDHACLKGPAHYTFFVQHAQ